MTSRCGAVLLAVFFVSLPASAGILMPQEPGAEPLTVRRQSLRLLVTDQVARATVDEVFENLTDRPMEGRYLLPLPEGAAISGFATWVEGRRVESRVEEKAEAQQAYRDAQQRGAQPALLEQPAPGTFSTRVDGIPAHGTKRVEASYAQLLPYDSGMVTLRIPLASKGVHGAAPAGQFEVQVDVSDSKKITDVDVSLPGARVVRLGATAFNVRFTAGGVIPPEELVLHYRTESSKLGLSFVTYRPEGAQDGYFLLLASPQELTSEADIVKKDVLFVFDTSGSMAEDHKIEQARGALKRCLSYLNAEDRFGIVAFNDALNPYRNKLLPASKANLQDATQFADGLMANGGTDIHSALAAGLKMLDDPARPHVIVFMTDGMPTSGVTAVSDITQLIHAANHSETRIFSFGVGNDVNRVLLEKLGRENRGAVDYVAPGQSIDKVIGGFYAKIAKPVLSDLAFDFGEVTTTMQYPDVQPDLYKGSQLVMVGRYRGAGKVHASLKGTLNGQKVSLPFTAEFPVRSERDSFVARLWAERRIDALLSQIRLTGERPETKSEVIALSKQYQLVTPYTSLVAVRPGALVASVFPQRVKPGDPVVHVRAPKSSQVFVHLPAFQEVKHARWDEELGLWTTRFLVPAGTADGSYPIRIEIRHEDGRLEWLAEEIHIDSKGPALTAKSSSVRPGGQLALHAQAVLSPWEVVTALFSRDDRAEALKALVDVRRVTAHLWDGRDVELALERDGRGFGAKVETNSSLVPGRYPVVFSAQDFAGNLAQTEAVVEVRSR